MLAEPWRRYSRRRRAFRACLREAVRRLLSVSRLRTSPGRAKVCPGAPGSLNSDSGDHPARPAALDAVVAPLPSRPARRSTSAELHRPLHPSRYATPPSAAAATTPSSETAAFCSRRAPSCRDVWRAVRPCPMSPAGAESTITSRRGREDAPTWWSPDRFRSDHTRCSGTWTTGPGYRRERRAGYARAAPLHRPPLRDDGPRSVRSSLATRAASAR